MRAPFGARASKLLPSDQPVKAIWRSDPKPSRAFVMREKGASYAPQLVSGLGRSVR
jgi:hypothetical protein